MNNDTNLEHLESQSTPSELNRVAIQHLLSVLSLLVKSTRILTVHLFSKLHDASFRVGKESGCREA